MRRLPPPAWGWLLLGFVLAGNGGSAQELLVNGVPVAGVTSGLVPEQAYAPAGELAAALGADLAFDGVAGEAVLELAGRVLVLPVSEDPGTAATGGNRFQGQPYPGSAAVFSQGLLYLPVRTVGSAFGGSVAFLAASNQITVVLPRAVPGALLVSRTGEGERLILELDAPVPYSSFFNAPLNALQIRFERTDAQRVDAVEGELFQRASIVPGSGYTDLQLILRPGVDYRLYTDPARRGYRLVLDLLPAGEVAPPSAVRFRVVLDPGHGGADGGLDLAPYGLERDLVLGFAEALAAELRGRQVEVLLTREQGPAAIETRTARAAGADLFVSLHAAPLPRGQLAIYYLGDPDGVTPLTFAVQENAEGLLRQGVTDEVRRSILLGLAPDLALGQRYAQRLASELFGAAGYQSGPPTPAPLAVLLGAGGRGLLVEVSPQDLSDPALPDVFASVLLTILSAGALP